MIFLAKNILKKNLLFMQVNNFIYQLANKEG